MRVSALYVLSIFRSQGNALCTVKSLEQTKILLIRTTAFEKTKILNEETQIEEVKVEGNIEMGSVSWISEESKQSSRPGKKENIMETKD